MRLDILVIDHRHSRWLEKCDALKAVIRTMGHLKGGGNLPEQV